MGRLFSSRSAAVVTVLTFGTLAVIEVSDGATRQVSGDRVDDGGTANAIGLSVLAATAATCGSLLRRPPRPLPRSRAFGFGIALTWLGIAVNRWARWTLGGQYRPRVTIVERHEVETGGPYAFVRHPMYLGSTLICAGLAVTVATPVAAAAWLVPLTGVARRIAVEERVLREALGERYEAFAAARARLVPGVW